MLQGIDDSGKKYEMDLDDEGLVIQKEVEDKMQMDDMMLEDYDEAELR
jgi:hypothetical protein